MYCETALTSLDSYTISDSTCGISSISCSGRWLNEIEYQDLIKKIKLAEEKAFPTDIVDVIYNPPATIIHWSDKTKTVVKVQEGDEYNPEHGFLMAIAKRAFGNDNTFNKVLHKWCNVDEINRTLNLRELKQIKKQANAAKKRAEKLINETDELIQDIKHSPIFDVGDKVVMYQHLDEANRKYEPNIGTVGTVYTVDCNDVMVEWPANSVEGYGEDTLWWLPKKSVRHTNK